MIGNQVKNLKYVLTDKLGTIGMKTEILKLVDLRHYSSEGKCGIPIVDLKLKLGIEIGELNGFLSELYKEKKIVVRKGINNLLVFKKV